MFELAIHNDPSRRTGSLGAADSTEVESAVPVGETKGYSRVDATGGVQHATAGSDGDSLTFGNVTLHGVGIHRVTEGTIEVFVPLNQGTFFMPQATLPAVELEIPESFVAKLTVEIGRVGADKRPTITKLNLDFGAHEVVVKNPVSALRPYASAWKNKVGDMMGDMHIKGLHAEDDGSLHMSGWISRTVLPNQDLDPEVKGELPDLYLDLQTIWERGSLTKPTEDAQPVPAPKTQLESQKSTTALLQALAPLMGEIAYEVDLSTEPTEIWFETPDGKLVTGKEPMVFHGSGTAEIDARGLLAFSNINRVTTGAADVNVVTKARDFNIATKTGTAKVKAKATTNVAKATMRRAFGAVGVELDPGSRVDVTATAKLDDARLSLENGDARWLLTGRPNRIDVDYQGKSASVDPGDTSITMGGRTDFAMGVDMLLNAENGEWQVEVSGKDIKAEVAGIPVELPGAAEALLTSRDFAFDGENPMGHGTMNYNIGVLAERELNYVATEQGLALDGHQIRHALPVGNLAGDPDKIAASDGPAAGNFDTVEGMNSLIDRIARKDVSNAAVSVNNTARLLSCGRQNQRELVAHLEGVTQPELDAVINDSQAKRLEMINSTKAGDSICLQTLIFKDDATGFATARALAAAAKRGVKVKVLIDALGNVAGFGDLTEGKQVYRLMRDAGVEMGLYNDGGAESLGKLIKLIEDHPELPQLSAEDLANPAAGMGKFYDLFQIAQGGGNVPPRVRIQVAKALGELSVKMMRDERTFDLLGKIEPDGKLSQDELIALVEYVAEVNHRTHQKRLAVVRADGTAEAVTGGRNIADEYLLAKGELYVTASGEKRAAWRDCDIYLAGASARAVFDGFTPLWEHVAHSDSRLSAFAAAPRHQDGPGQGDSTVMNVEHLPRLHDDYNILNAEIEIIKSLGKGDVYYGDNAYLCPEGAMGHLKDALVAAAKRGVEIHLVTNAPGTTDLVNINRVGVFSYRDMLEVGIKIYERDVEEPLAGADSGGRTNHSKISVARKKGGRGVARVSSWNNDNRSAKLNSENADYVWGEDPLIDELERVIREDIAAAHEIKLEDVAYRTIEAEIRASFLLLFCGRSL